MAETRHVFTTLDFLRGIAAIAVVCFHYSQSISVLLLPHAFLAVDFFFMLSGFVLAYAYEARFREGLTLKQFMKIRIVRLYPLYLIGITIPLISIGVLAFLQMPHDNILRSALTYCFHLLLIPTPPVFAENPGPLFPLNLPAWSLFYELVINVFYGFVAVALTTTRLTSLILLSFVGMVAFVIFPQGSPFLLPRRFKIIQNAIFFIRFRLYSVHGLPRIFCKIQTGLRHQRGHDLKTAKRRCPHHEALKHSLQKRQTI